MWQEKEKQAYEWFCNNYDKEAIYFGRHNSKKPDIYSPKLNCYIEVKCPKAQCGQFTEKTASKNPYSFNIMRGEPVEKEWVKYDLQQKQIKYVIIVFSQPHLYILEDFLRASVIKLEKRSTKKSGSRKCSKKVRETLIKEGYELFLKEGRTYLNNPSNERITIDDKDVLLSREVRILSHTNNPTWIFSLEVKNDSSV